MECVVGLELWAKGSPELGLEWAYLCPVVKLRSVWNYALVEEGRICGGSLPQRLTVSPGSCHLLIQFIIFFPTRDKSKGFFFFFKAKAQRHSSKGPEPHSKA